jgi:hypothetical protein
VDGEHSRPLDLYTDRELLAAIVADAPASGGGPLHVSEHLLDEVRRRLHDEAGVEAVRTDEITAYFHPDFPGRLIRPFPFRHCANTACLSQLTESAYLFKQLTNGRLAVFCDDCAAHLELNCRERFALVVA